MSEVVLSYIEDYSREQVYPFFESIRSTQFDGDIVVFTNKIDNRCSSYLSKVSTHTINVRRLDLKGKHKLPHFVSRLFGDDEVIISPDLSINESLCKFISNFGLTSSPISHFITKKTLHCNCARFLYFQSFLDKTDYDRVLIADARDTIFQSDPFFEHKSYFKDSSIVVSEEFPNPTLGNQDDNAFWIRSMFGESVLDNMSRYPIICAGAILSEGGIISELLEDINKMIISNYIGWGTDQGAINYLLRGSFSDKVNVFEYSKGPISHLGIAPRETIHTDAQNRVLNSDGDPFSIVHQYDRHQDIENVVLRKHH
jgi:hypothetical protein